jgi:ATP-binding cassette subfamily B protein
VNARLNNNLLGLATIKSFATEQFEAQRIREASEFYRQTNANAIKISSAITPVIRMAILAGFTTTLVYGGYLTIHGDLAVGAYSVLVYLTQRLLWPMTRLADVADMYQRSMTSIDRALGLLETPIAISYDGRAMPVPSVTGTLFFDRVSFSYDRQRAALSDIAITIPAGKTIAFVGPTGSGKSTLVKLLLRFYHPDQGQILLDDVNVEAIKLQDLRRAMAYVSQDTFLTDGTVAENIAYGLPEVAEQQIRDAAIAAEAMEFIDKLPLGFATRIGERGQKLSGGQRQRLALARAILRNPPVLILDEATSAVDNETEAAIQRSLDVISKNRTTVVIAHRLSTVRHADCIHVLDNGRIVESGTHDQLMQQNAIYAGLWRLQTGEKNQSSGALQKNVE